jgi:hypothetical protein
MERELNPIFYFIAVPLNKDTNSKHFAMKLKENIPELS